MEEDGATVVAPANGKSTELAVRCCLLELRAIAKGATPFLEEALLEEGAKEGVASGGFRPRQSDDRVPRPRFGNERAHARGCLCVGWLAGVLL